MTGDADTPPLHLSTAFDPTTGTLRLSYDGVDYVDDVRVVRCQAPVAGDGWYRIGAQFLWTSHPGARSLRRVIAAMQGGESRLRFETNN